MVHTSNLRGIGCMVLATAAFVANDTLLKLALEGAPPMQVLMLRNVFALAWCLPAVVILGHRAQIGQIVNRWIALRALCEVVAISSFMQALGIMSIGDITAIYQVSPLLVILGVAFIWRERIGSLRMACIACGFLGGVLVAQPGTDATSFYAIFAVVTAFGAAARDIVSRKVPAHVPGILIALSVIIAVLIVATASTLMFETWASMTNRSWIFLVFAGFFLMIAQTFVFLAFRFGSANAVAPFAYMSTLFAVLSQVTVFTDIPNWISILGMALIIASGIVVISLERRALKQKEAEPVHPL
jgi:drug/metabolite transporter (DMT)-like permease